MDDDPTPGSFRLENEDTETHTARVRVDGEQRAQFTLETGRWWEEEDFLTEAGRHRVAIELESGEFEGVRADIRESSASSVGRTGDAILGTITSGGGLSVGVGVYD